jgi:hypothetical protein
MNFESKYMGGGIKIGKGLTKYIIVGEWGNSVKMQLMFRSMD